MKDLSPWHLLPKKGTNKQAGEGCQLPNRKQLVCFALSLCVCCPVCVCAHVACLDDDDVCSKAEAELQSTLSKDVANLCSALHTIPKANNANDFMPTIEITILGDLNS